MKSNRYVLSLLSFNPVKGEVDEDTSWSVADDFNGAIGGVIVEHKYRVTDFNQTASMPARCTALHSSHASFRRTSD